MGISEAAYYNWKKKYGGLGVLKLRRIKQLEEENQHLKHLMADLSLDKQMLRDVLKKSSEARAASHVPHHLIDAYRISARGPAEYSAYNAPASRISHTGETVLRQRLRLPGASAGALR